MQHVSIAMDYCYKESIEFGTNIVFSICHQGGGYLLVSM